MEEEQNITEQSAKEYSQSNEENKTVDENVQPVIEPEFLPNDPDGQIPISNTKTAEKMEVHHHGHVHAKKKWLEYLFQFFMLFLAVFCGFLAEYELEHKIEKDRAKELAKSFYYELKSDSATAVIKVQNRIKQEEALKYLIKYFKDSSLTSVPKEFAMNFLYGLTFRTPSLFEPQTIILEQLKNSGSLRYFKNDELQKLIGQLTVSIKNIYDRQELESQNRSQYINPIIIDHYDYDFDARLKEGSTSVFDGIKKYEASTENIPFQIKGTDKFDREGIINKLSFYQGNIISSTRITFIQNYMDLNSELLKELRNEYNIKD